VLLTRLLMGLWSPLSWILISLMCNPFVSSSLCPTMLKGQWLNILGWIYWLDYGWGFFFFFFPISSEKLSQYNKLANIAMVRVHWEDERTFSNFFSWRTTFETSYQLTWTCVLGCLFKKKSHCLTSHMMMQLHYGRRWQWGIRFNYKFDFWFWRFLFKL